MLNKTHLNSILEQFEYMKIKAENRLYEFPPKHTHRQPFVVLAEQIPPSLRNRLWQLGYKRFFHYNGFSFMTVKNTPTKLLGTTDKGEPIYAKDWGTPRCTRSPHQGQALEQPQACKAVP